MRKLVIALSLCVVLLTSCVETYYPVYRPQHHFGWWGWGVRGWGHENHFEHHGRYHGGWHGEGHRDGHRH